MYIPTAINKTAKPIPPAKRAICFVDIPPPDWFAAAVVLAAACPVPVVVAAAFPDGAADWTGPFEETTLAILVAFDVAGMVAGALGGTVPTGGGTTLTAEAGCVGMATIFAS